MRRRFPPACLSDAAIELASPSSTSERERLEAELSFVLVVDRAVEDGAGEGDEAEVDIAGEGEGESEALAARQMGWVKVGLVGLIVSTDEVAAGSVGDDERGRVSMGEMSSSDTIGVLGWDVGARGSPLRGVRGP